jgi:dCTP diphosphatase
MIIERRIACTAAGSQIGGSRERQIGGHDGEGIEFRDSRDWRQFHDPKNLAEAICIESAELLEKFLWTSTSESSCVNGEKLVEIKEEIADIMIFLIYLCYGLNVDLPLEVERKIRINEDKYPLHLARGKAHKHTYYSRGEA